MNDNILNILYVSKGIYEDASSHHLCPVKQIKLIDLYENIYNYDIYLKINENKVFLQVFEKEKKLSKNYKLEKNNQDIENGAIIFANSIYNTTYYKTKFSYLSYSKNSDKIIISNYWNHDNLINVYSKDDLPATYYELKNDIYENTKIICHLLYKNELIEYIKQFDIKTNEKSFFLFSIDNLTW
jgi:hypothetical protein